VTISSSIYQEMKLPFIVCATSAVYCAVMNKNIQTFEKPITYSIMLCSILEVHKVAVEEIEHPPLGVSMDSTAEKICAYVKIMSVFFVPALIYGKAQSWLLCNIAEFVTDTLKFTIGNLSVTLGLHYQGLEWQSLEEDPLQAVGSTAPESDQGEII
jgi:hypothetical protein